MTESSPANRPIPHPAVPRVEVSGEAAGSALESTDTAPSAFIASVIPFILETPPSCGEGKNAMPHRAMVDMTSPRSDASPAVSSRASRDWQRPVSWRPFAAENPFASLLIAGAVVAGLGLSGSGIARADETKASETKTSTQPQVQPSVPLLLAQTETAGGPQVSLMQPAYADVLKGDTSILVGIQPGRYNAAAIELFVDDHSATGGPIPLTSSASTSFHWDTAKFLDGPHKLTVRVTDTQGFIGQTEVQVFVNNNKIQNTTPPTLSWLNTPRGLLRGKVQLQLRAAGTFGVKFIMVSLNSAATPDIKPALATWFTNVPPYIISLDTTKYPDGLYVLSALGQNGLGEEGEAQQVKFGISNNSINPTWNTGEILDNSAPTGGVATQSNSQMQVPTSKRGGINDPAQLTTVLKAREGAAEGTRSFDGSTQVANQSGSSATSRIAEVNANPRAMTQRGAAPPTGAAPKTRMAPTTGMAPTAGTTAPVGTGTRLATTAGQPKPRVAAIPPAELSVAPVTSRTAMQGQVASNNTVASGSAAVESLPSMPRDVRIAPPVTVKSGANGTGKVNKSTDPQRTAMLPDRTPSHLQTRDDVTITVSPSQQTLAFPTSYRARKGETLQQVATRYGLPADILASVNEIGVGEPLQDGQIVRLAQPLTVSYQGKPVKGDVSSMMMGNVAVTPFRFLFQKQGGTMTYDPIKHQVHAQNATQEVTLTIGSDTALVNQKEVAMDLAAFLLTGRTMIPVRFFEKALHAQVEWTPATGRVYVAMTP